MGRFTCTGLLYSSTHAHCCRCCHCTFPKKWAPTPVLSHDSEGLHGGCRPGLGCKRASLCVLAQVCARARVTCASQHACMAPPPPPLAPPTGWVELLHVSVVLAVSERLGAWAHVSLRGLCHSGLRINACDLEARQQGGLPHSTTHTKHFTHRVCTPLLGTVRAHNVPQLPCLKPMLGGCTALPSDTCNASLMLARQYRLTVHWRVCCVR